MSAPLPLSGQVALVTGGAGGIGSAICEVLAAAGASLVVGYGRNAEGAQRLVEQLPVLLPNQAHRATHVPVDDSAALADVARDVLTQEGRLDILVNNAGLTTPVPHEDLEGLSDEWIDRIFQVNVRGSFACIRAFAPLLRQSGGLVVNISSIAGRTGMGSNVAYCASKAAVDSLTRSLGRALAPHIRVLSVSPGWVDGDYAQRMPSELIQAQADLTPLGRIAQPHEVAQAVLAVATLLPFSTGCIIPVDGGRPLGI